IAATVTEGPSTYDPACPGGLKINFKDTLAQYYKDYRRHHGHTPTKTSSESTVKKNRKKTSIITVGPAKLCFNRTLRVRDDNKTYALPPGLGTFPVVNANDYAPTLPDYIKRRGGYIVPMFQREALWIGIDGGRCAIKISVGGINAITGQKHDEAPRNGTQDYILGAKQPWLDGIATEPGVVRQFVAMKLGYGYTIEEQLAITATGGIQVDVFPTLIGVVSFRHADSQRQLNLGMTPEQLGIGDMVSDALDMPRDGERLRMIFEGKELAEERTVSGMGLCAPRVLISRPEIQIMGSGRRVPFISISGDGRMGIAAGGKISQRIYEDDFSPATYDEENAHRVFIHTVSTAAWEIITGVVCPITPITPKLYEAFKLPWFALYDEHLPTVHPNDAFKAVKSISALDNASPASAKLINPDAPPNCAQHSTRKGACVARPCGHSACTECFGESVMGGDNECVVCGQKVEKFVGFKKPVPKMKRGGGSEGLWWEAEAQIGGELKGSPSVITLMLDEDAVSAPH
ncbi:hypothetical protein B0H16DRAFT_1314658, partial [Mycena metata]